MRLHKLILTQNDCYKAGRKMKVKGLMLHSTGANNPKLSRYVGPDDGILGPNKYNNHWNQPKPDGRNVCVHGFIGLDKNGDVRTYQTLPWDMQGWHAGGTANQSYIGVEICEDDTKDSKYFNKVYKEAVELYTYLCVEFDLTEKDIIDHSEGYRMGIASNHGDVKHWFSKHGKSMDTFRADVKKSLGEYSGNQSKPTTSKPKPNNTSKKGVDTLAREVIAGLHGNGEDRKKSLGSRYPEVQKRVNELSGKSKPKPIKGVDTLAREVIAGLHGNGEDRKKSLGSRYPEVQKRVNELQGGKKSKNPVNNKSIETLVKETLAGVYGNGAERKKALGSKYPTVQGRINRMLKK